jgi:hypothetical protein
MLESIQRPILSDKFITELVPKLSCIEKIEDLVSENDLKKKFIEGSFILHLFRKRKKIHFRPILLL